MPTWLIILLGLAYTVFIYLVGANNPLPSVKKKIKEEVNKL